jgi:hypothetical protein
MYRRRQASSRNVEATAARPKRAPPDEHGQRYDTHRSGANAYAVAAAPVSNRYQRRQHENGHRDHSGVVGRGRVCERRRRRRRKWRAFAPTLTTAWCRGAKSSARRGRGLPVRIAGTVRCRLEYMTKAPVAQAGQSASRPALHAAKAGVEKGKPLITLARAATGLLRRLAQPFAGHHAPLRAVAKPALRGLVGGAGSTRSRIFCRVASALFAIAASFRCVTTRSATGLR